jgi:thiol-disulfide isomerase/thioredoxin
MKNLFYLLSLFLISFACVYRQPEKLEIRFISGAVKEAKVANKLLIIEFWAPECGPCIRLKHDIFENENNTEFLNKNFVIAKVSPSDSIYKPLWKHYNLEYQSTVIFLDMNGNEIDRTVSYDGNRDAYLNFLKEISEGINLYSVVLSTYFKDTMNVNSNYVLAKKLMLRYQFKEAVHHFNKVLLLDRDNNFRHNPECRFRIAELELMLTGDVQKMQELNHKNLKETELVQTLKK